MEAKEFHQIEKLSIERLSDEVMRTKDAWVRMCLRVSGMGLEEARERCEIRITPGYLMDVNGCDEYALIEVATGKQVGPALVIDFPHRREFRPIM